MTQAEITSCEDALRLLAQYLDGELEARSRAQIDRHLEMCRSCYSRAEFEKRLKAQVARVGREAVPPRLERRIRTLMHDFAARGPE
jgi:anti-sigma factor (TIGR02949 family)